MRRIVVSEFVTLDGVMQGPGGRDEDRRGGFEHGGWQMPYNDKVGEDAVLEGLARSGGYILGRRTYEIFASYWPLQPPEDPFAAKLNSLPKYVASTTLKEPLKWSNSTLIKGDLAEGVRRLKQQDGKDLQIIGSGDMAQTLMKNGLVDEYQLMVHPVVLGSGMRLFRDGVPKMPLELVDSKITTTGVAILTYRPIRPKA